MSSFSRSPQQIPECYAVLGVPPDISASELTRHYKKLSLRYHPDRVAYRTDASAEDVSKKFNEITAAYKVLSDPQMRTRYDMRHGVNFRSRTSVIQQSIFRHNDGVLTTAPDSGDEPFAKRLREDTGPLCASAPTAAAPAKEKGNEESDDEEEEYSPEESSSHERGDISVHKARGPPQLQSFLVSPVAVKDVEPSRQCWKGVTIRRHRGCTGGWGLELAQEGRFTLVHCDGVSAGHVPVPSVIVQVNHYNLGRCDDLATVIATSPEKKQSSEERSGTFGSRLRVYMGEALPPASDAAEEPDSFLVDVEELQLVVTYCSRWYQLWGGLELLAAEDRETVLLLVPDPQRAEVVLISTELDRVTILSVNQVSVSNGEELRAALQSEARRSLGEEAEHTELHSRHRPLLLECCTLHGLPSSLLR